MRCRGLRGAPPRVSSARPPAPPPAPGRSPPHQPQPDRPGHDGDRPLRDDARLRVDHRPQDIGAGGTPVSFSANLGGLAPGTTYHFDIVAVNGDGTTVSPDATFTTIRATALSITKSSATGPQLILTLACNGGTSGSRCSGPIALTSKVTSQGKSIVAVSASAAKAKPKPKPKKGGAPKKVTKTMSVGKGAFSVATGHTATVRLKLNATGLKLLSQLYKLPTKVSLGGSAPASKNVTFSYARLHVVPAYQWAFSNTFAFATQLTLSGLPRKSHVAVVCRGGGCPFARSRSPLPSTASSSSPRRSSSVT